MNVTENGGLNSDIWGKISKQTSFDFLLSNYEIVILICIRYDELQAFADELGIPFIETSAKDSINVEEAFLTMSAEIKKR